jgi:hypothetical protein
VLGAQDPHVANALPKSVPPGATKAIQEIHDAEDRAQAEQAIEAFARTYGVKWPKAVAKITDDAVTGVLGLINVTLPAAG